MRTESGVISYIGNNIDSRRNLNNDYTNSIDYLRQGSTTETGGDLETIIPLLNQKGSIFSDLSEDIIRNKKIRPFLNELNKAFLLHKNPNYTYLPISVGEHNDDEIILDWIYEAVRISFYFLKDKDVYSVTRYDLQKNSYSQTIEELEEKRYKEIAEKVIREVS